MIRLFDYISNWFGILFLLWLFLKQSGYKNYDYINPYFSIYFIFFGYIIYILINILKGVKFDRFYIIIGLITHYAPIYFFNLINAKQNDHSFTFFIITLMIYLFYLSIYLNKTPMDIYITDKQVVNLKEFLTKIKLLS